MDVRDLCKSDKAIEKTRATLTARGAEVLSTTNPYEILRFRSAYGVGVVYKNSAGRITPNPEAVRALEVIAGLAAGSLAPSKVPHRPQRKRRQRLIAQVIERDGADCFFCGEPLAPESDETPESERTTLEHLLSVTHGGPTHIANSFVAHKGCNERAGHLSAPEKIALRDEMRAAAASRRAAA